jgi:hypothetical protein
MDSMKILLAAMVVRLPPLMKTPKVFYVDCDESASPNASTEESRSKFGVGRENIAKVDCTDISNQQEDFEVGQGGIPNRSLDEVSAGKFDSITESDSTDLALFEGKDLAA